MLGGTCSFGVISSKFFMSKRVLVIGSGFSGLSVATSLAQKGFEVIIVEKHDQAGGRARKFSEQGFTFDMGPSWYWMPDVFESYFARFGKKVSDYYSLKRLDPSYNVYWGKHDYTPVPANVDELVALFEREDPGSGVRLQKFLKEAKYKYEVGINRLVYKPGQSLREFADWELIRGVLKLDVFKSLSAHARKVTSHPRLIQILEFPVLFLGALPQKTPALYSLMNYADLVLGTWFPDGGMVKIVEAMVELAKENKVQFLLNTPVDEIIIKEGRAIGIRSGNSVIEADVVVSSADYHHTETQLIPKEFRSYSDKYWDSRVMAPSSLIYYLGVDKRLKNLSHHNLFFDQEFESHANDIYAHPAWPKNPLFYASLTTQTDPSGAPEGSENLFLLSDTLKSHKSIIISIESSKRIFKENSTNKFNTFHLFFKKVIETIDTTYEYKLIVNSSFKNIIIQQKYNDTTYLRPEGYMFFKEFGVYLRIILLYNSELEHNILPNTGKKEDFIELEEILKNITLSKN
jgi:phytoene desaturase